MTSSPPPIPVDGAAATYQGKSEPKDTTAQATGGVALEWMLMKDVDPSSGYQTPPPPEHAPEYEGQVVIVPAVDERS